jgi:membrane associated rhomboid family serine protease
MIPFRDNIPSRSFPIITVFIIVINTLAFLYELSLGPGLDRFVYHFAVIPAQVLAGPSAGVSIPDLALPFLTSMFLHGGWLHLIGNMWYLWIFGDNVEDRLGHFNYLLFYLLCGLGAGIAHTLLNANSTIPSLGASGAIAGVLGAYLVSYPFARVLTLVPIFVFIQIIEIPALIVLGFWFIMQFLYGAASLTSPTAASGGGVAWWAHVGGFVVGILLLQLFPKRPVEYARY